ncbi:ABC transporter permease [Nesterenkonia sphaerica]|uniref:ABC transporter permease n=1 Tax=Nesterenkonia sphaerica TaxID=1804988 RepID=A0A5R9AMC3_9MICC|nr:hypothetical protein [Nesterenkonia sphaerica]TLP78957.1 hypothetical protein FEF27_03635 [Nesterenkonia sphaerica]
MSALAAQSGPAPARASGPATFTGTLGLLRFMLRRDRFRSTVWVAGIGLLGFYFAHAIQVIAEDEAELAQLATLFTDPVGRLMTGPAFGMEAPTFERFFSAGYVLFIYLLIALMSMFTVVRHTRAEEQSGRAELLRSNVVGRHATLSATLSLVVLLNLAAGLLVFGGALTAGYAAEGSALVAAAGAGSGLFFAGTAAISAQLSASARACSAMAGAALAAAYVIRMGGDMAAQGGSVLSWFSPLGWAQQTAPYVEDRWWILALLFGTAAVQLWIGYWLSTRRDLEASLVPTRLGRQYARPALGSPLGLAVRTLKGGLRGWGIGLVLAGLVFGAYAQTLLDAGENLPEEIRQIFTGESMVLGYLAHRGVFLAIFVAAAGVGGLTQLRGEERRGRAELLLSAPVSRTKWLGTHLVVILGGAALLLLLVGLGMGLGAAAVLEADAGRYFVYCVAASVLQLPAVLAVLGIVTALFGWWPRAAGPVGWTLIGYCAFMITFGQLLDLPEVFHQVNIFGHLAQYPVEDVTWAPILALSALGLIGLLSGIWGWNRREINRV